MRNRIDLKKYNIRTDLVIDHNLNNINKETKVISDNLKITTIKVTDSLSKNLNKKKGTYITLEFTDITNHEDQIEIESYLTKELKNILKQLNIKASDEGLIIGLGNKLSTADSLGPKTIEKILVTRHLFELNTNTKDGIRPISAITPGVMATTGIETFDIISSIKDKINPNCLIIIDALASSSIDRINKTIQITDTGINPGSGIGNNRKELSPETLKTKVISIGVPTVVDSSIIVNDTITYLFKHISYLKNHYNTNKLIINRNNTYKKNIENLSLTKKEKQEISGLLGTLNEEEKKSLITEVLTNIHNDMIVTPKEIDFLIEKLSDSIAKSINKSLHSALNDWQIKIFFLQ